ncbi:hypothetical protein ANN_05879 [Periplaneta americana]|uniref:Endonuclease-reverse transcriptase n=1 Tax=Periplaneta americana TaxID=6978 RepID=A0ABQ8TEH0_PERAM|nr:hypothetical protein ANN_05879 [Periplaneta americana]
MHDLAKLYSSGHQHSLKCAKGKRSRPVCTVVHQEEIESIPTSSYECTMVHCVLRGLVVGPNHHGMESPQVADRGDGLQIRRVALVTKPQNKPRNGTDSLTRPQQRNKVLRFGTWNVTSLYRTGGVTLGAKKLVRYKIEFVGVQEVRLDGNSISQIGDYLLHYGEGNDNHQLGTGFFIHKRIKSAVKKVDIISDRLSYLVLKGRWTFALIFNQAHCLEFCLFEDEIRNRYASWETLRHEARCAYPLGMMNTGLLVGIQTTGRLLIYFVLIIAYATVTNINDIREEIKHRINMGNACYYSVEKLLSSNLLSKNLEVRIYKTIILPVVQYGCETWTLALREEHRLRVFENKFLRKIFWAKRDEVTGEWRKLNNTELHALYSSPDIIRNNKSRRSRWAGHVARMGESRNAYRVLVRRPEGKRPLGRPRRRWEDIKMDLREVGYDDRDWINLAQDRDRWQAYVRAAMNLRVP